MKSLKKLLCSILIGVIMLSQYTFGFAFNPIYKGDVCLNGIPIVPQSLFPITKEINGRTYMELETLVRSFDLKLSYEGPILWKGDLGPEGSKVVTRKDIDTQKALYINGLDIWVPAKNQQPQNNYSITLEKDDTKINLRTNSPLVVVNGNNSYFETLNNKIDESVKTRIEVDQATINQYDMNKHIRYIYVPLKFIVNLLGGSLQRQEDVLYIEMNNVPQLYPRGYETPITYPQGTANYIDFWSEANILKSYLNPALNKNSYPSVFREVLFYSTETKSLEPEYDPVIIVYPHCEDPRFMISTPCNDIEIKLFTFPDSIHDGSGDHSIFDERAYIRMIFNYYLPNGGNKLYDIFYRGYSGDLTPEEDAQLEAGQVNLDGKVTGQDIQHLIGSDGKKVIVVPGNHTFSIYIITPGNCKPFCSNHT